MTEQEQTPEQLKKIIEAVILSYGKALSVTQIKHVFPEESQPSETQIRDAITLIQQDYQDRSVELKEVASGFRFQAKQDYAEWIARLWEEKPVRYSRALLETLALVAYRQPITRAEIEEVRGVAVSSSIIKTLLEREWIRVVGHKDAPGKPALYATTKTFLDYFNLKNLSDLPSLAELRDFDQINSELNLSETSLSELNDNEKVDEASALLSNDTDTDLEQSDEDDHVVHLDSVAHSDSDVDLDSDEVETVDNSDFEEAVYETVDTQDEESSHELIEDEFIENEPIQNENIQNKEVTLDEHLSSDVDSLESEMMDG